MIERIENGMIVGAVFYDREQELPNQILCNVCEEIKPAYDSKFLDSGYAICSDCQKAIAKHLLLDERFYSEYLPENICSSKLAWIIRAGIEAVKGTFDAWEVPVWELDYLLKNAEFLEKVRK